MASRKCATLTQAACSQLLSSTVCLEAWPKMLIHTLRQHFQFVFWKHSIEFVKVLELSNCVSSLMCQFENGELCRFPWSPSSKACLYCLEYIYNMND